MGQDAVKAVLAGDLRTGNVPPALLFYGPPGSGKMTAALETARALSCEREADWNCPCPQCARHRQLVHGDLLVFGRRTFPEEIAAAREFAVRSPGPPSAYFFHRAVRKLLARFSPALWAGDESKVAKAAPIIQEIEECLDFFDPEKTPKTELPPALSRAVENAAELASTLEPMLPAMPPVSMIRNMETWAQLAPSGKRKTAIIENADAMQDSARNAMLKILEEPPGTVRFILLTCRRASLMATILSRSRIYSFAPRDAAATADVLRRVFKTEEKAESILDYFEARVAFPPAAARRHAELFLGIILRDLGAKEGGSGAESGGFAAGLARAAAAEGTSLPGFLEKLKTETGGFGSKDRKYSGSFAQFLRSLCEVCARILADPGTTPGMVALVEKWMSKARQAGISQRALNRSPELLLETLAYSLGDAS